MFLSFEKTEKTPFEALCVLSAPNPTESSYFTSPPASDAILGASVITMMKSWELGAGRASKSAGRALELAGGTEKKNSKGAFSVCNGTIGLVPYGAAA